MGNEFDERYDIRIANRDDIDKLMGFIGRYWKKGHILATSRSFFEYEFCNGDRVNFVIAVDRNTNEIECIQGFIPCSKGDIPEKFDYWGCMWKLNETHDNIPLLGIEVCQRTKGILNARLDLGSGLNPKTALPLVKKLFKSKTGKMKQYYMLGNSEDFTVAKIVDCPQKPQYCACPDYLSVVRYYSFEEMKKQFDVNSVDALPYKDAWYINKRYYQHPIYEYKVYGVVEYEQTKTLLVTREIECKGKKILRVVDCIGEHGLISFLGAFFERLLKDGEYEYIDFYEYGVNDEYFTNAGLTLRKDDDVNIIPNYFQPYVQENVDIWVSFPVDGTVFFKADSDQDRPNYI